MEYLDDRFFQFVKFTLTHSIVRAAMLQWLEHMPGDDL